MMIGLGDETDLVAETPVNPLVPEPTAADWANWQQQLAYRNARIQDIYIAEGLDPATAPQTPMSAIQPPPATPVGDTVAAVAAVAAPVAAAWWLTTL